jgi:hypothetical protein
MPARGLSQIETARRQIEEMNQRGSGRPAHGNPGDICATFSELSILRVALAGWSADT